MSALRKAPPIIAGIGAFLILFEILLFASLDFDVRPADVINACGVESRIAPEDTYSSLALDLVFPKLKFLSEFDEPETLWSQRVQIAALRGLWLASIKDRCLRAYVRKWLAFYDGEAVEALARRERPSPTNTTRERQLADRMALAVQLGIAPSEVTH